jgi:transposase
MDEAGMNDNESYAYGWAVKGKRCFAKKPGHRHTRINFAAALLNEKLIAPFVFEGYCTRNLFDAYVEHCLIPALTAGMVVIADNAAFHKSPRAQQLLEEKGCKLVFLPPYSPDFNPIEHQWFSVKTRIRKALDKGIALEIAANQVLKEMSG